MKESDSSMNGHSKNTRTPRPTEKTAVALQYNCGEIPFVCATGSQELAQAIIDTAQTLQIPIYENDELLASLAKLELGEDIPRELYLIIAQLLAFVYYIKGKRPA